ncbi:hypothetical protein KGA66_02180 [Actinocrinis puniceicyclus]|uniref:Uncharacterized protein n=1 Tax=Actinocrinis puniceicyclus TaxID=977794 RepID=A0A8J8BCJ4_9ACTN|nr:hypothetical protein [Actinocrinis puniceicyclus]MBS2961839.1 hypothetical protein [Actinocrinis puniceicyclus]
MFVGMNALHFSHAPDPQRISLYLSSRGWVPDDDPGGTLWTSLDEEFQVFVPKSVRMRGYAKYIEDVLKTLSTAEDRSQAQITLEVSSSDADVQYVHTDADSDPGTTPINDGVRSFECLRQWVLSGAVFASSDLPRLVQPSRKPVPALDFMRTVRLGPTLEGSYVLTVYIPIPPLIGQTAIEMEDPRHNLATQPFERRVSLSLRKATREALNAASEVIQRREDMDAFTRRAASGVNANLCEALAGLSSETARDVAIDFSWALSRPVEPSPPIYVSRDQRTVLKEAAQELRAQAPEEDVTVVGAVVRLHRDGAFGAGEVSIAGIVEGGLNDRLRRVWVELAEDDYSRATRAHESGVTVTVTGSLIRRGTRHLLQNPSNFNVIPELP